ncbi:hypothetical protein lerEdw1_013490 [Lerista edwardsae]|nr:hypothetical protein lerEdw1_013492 [Lerista edwardsae]KAJ6650232.1 hypothetical protein lerEdw1_013490 [Lerista edwardsae]
MAAAPRCFGSILQKPLGKVFEFNGTNTSDLAEIPASAFYATYDLANFRWDSLEGNLNKTARTATFRGVSLDAAGSFSNGSISFQVTAFEDGSRDSPLPRLLHTANSSKVEFVIRGVAPRGNHSRFVLEIFTVEEAGRQQTLESLRSIDDEYTPTIFEIAQLVPRSVNSTVGSGFLQWKTVAYSAWDAKREDTVHCHYYPLQTENRTLPGASIAHAYFEAGALERGQGVAAINISFGGDNREAYEEKHYLSW